MAVSRASVLLGVNLARLKRGRRRVRHDARLDRIGEDRAKRAYRLGTHAGPGSFDLSGRWHTASEALAFLHRPAVDPVPLWLASDEHRPIILGKQWTHAGVGIYRRSGRVVVSLIVADRRA